MYTTFVCYNKQECLVVDEDGNTVMIYGGPFAKELAERHADAMNNPESCQISWDDFAKILTN